MFTWQLCWYLIKAINIHRRLNLYFRCYSMVMAYFSNSFNWNFIVNWIPYKMLQTFWKLFRLAKVQRLFKSLLPTFVFCFVLFHILMHSFLMFLMWQTKLNFLVCVSWSSAILNFLKLHFVSKMTIHLNFKDHFLWVKLFLSFYSQGWWAEKYAQTHKKRLEIIVRLKSKKWFC